MDELDPWADYLRNGVVRLSDTGERTVIPPPTTTTTPTRAPTPPQATATVQAPNYNRAYRDAIASIESAGSGGYRALGPRTRRGDRAYGRYQVMGANVGPWSYAALGRRLTPQEFLANPQAQDAVFDYQFGNYVRKYGNPQDAASAWFTGRPLSQGAGARDLYGTSGAGYVARFNRALGNPQPSGNDTMAKNNIPLPASPFPGGGGGAPAIYSPNLSPAHKKLQALLQAMEANRAQAPQQRGILGPILMGALASAASRIPGPAGGLASGLAHGLGGMAARRQNQGNEDYQRMLQQAHLYQLQEQEWKQENPDPEFQLVDTPTGKVWAEKYPGQMPHPVQPGGGGQPQGGDPSGFNLDVATPEDLAKAKADFAKNTEWYTTKAVDSYNSMKNLYEASKKHRSGANDMTFIKGVTNLISPGTIMRGANGEEYLDSSTSMYDKFVAAAKEAQGADGRISDKTRDEFMDAANQWIKAEKARAEGYQANAQKVWSPYHVKPDTFYLPELTINEMDMSKYGSGELPGVAPVEQPPEAYIKKGGTPGGWAKMPDEGKKRWQTMK